MRKEIGTSLLKPKKAVCAERLHEALKGAKVKNLVEAGERFPFRIGAQPICKTQGAEPRSAPVSST